MGVLGKGEEGRPDTRFVLFIRHFVFLFVFILKTLAFHYKYKVIFGCSVSRSLLYSVSVFIYLLQKSLVAISRNYYEKAIIWECSAE